MKNSVNLAELNAAGGRVSIFVNAEQEPIGILIPLAGWGNIAPAVANDCELYLLMSQLTFKPIFERSLKEQGELLAPVTRTNTVPPKTCLYMSTRTERNWLGSMPLLAKSRLSSSFPNEKATTVCFCRAEWCR